MSAMGRRLAVELGGNPDEILQLYREQVDTVHAAGLQIARIKARMAQLEARYGKSGQFGTHWDNERKQLLAEISEEERVRYSRDPEMTTDSKGNEKIVPLTDGRVSDLAHAHPRYKRFLEECRREREEHAKLAAELSVAFTDHEREKGVLEYLRAKLDVMKSLAYAYGAEARLTPN